MALAEPPAGELPVSALRLSPSGAVATPRTARVVFWLYWSHVVGLFGLAVSNGLLGLSVLALPFASPLERLRRREVRPVLLAVGGYLLLLGVAVAASFDPGFSLRFTSEAFSFATLIVGLVVVRSETAARRLVDAILLIATAEALLGLGQLAAAGGADLSRRIQGTLSHYMTFSGLLLVADMLLRAAHKED